MATAGAFCPICGIALEENCGLWCPQCALWVTPAAALSFSGRGYTRCNGCGTPLPWGSGQRCLGCEAAIPTELRRSDARWAEDSGPAQEWQAPSERPVLAVDCPHCQGDEEIAWTCPFCEGRGWVPAQAARNWLASWSLHRDPWPAKAALAALPRWPACGKCGEYSVERVQEHTYRRGGGYRVFRCGCGASWEERF